MIEFASTLGIDRDAVLKLINKNDSTPSHDEALLATELSHTGLNFRTTDILSKSGIRIVGELCSRSSAELLQVGIFGRNHLEEVRGLLASYGLTLRIPMSLQADSQMSLEEIPDSGLSPRTVKALRDVGITTLAQLCSYTRKSLLAKENIGRNTLEEIKEIFTRCGLTLPSE
jgi:DNA-directed RNA polymerase alpha subunit